MPLKLDYILRDVENISLDVLRDLISDAEKYYVSEINRYFEYKDGILKFDPVYRDAFIFGDIHGDYNTLRKLLMAIKFDTVIQDSYIIFLGDYIDRGDKQVETISLVLYILINYPDRVILLRGNHEPPEWLPVYPHDFPNILYLYFKEEAKNIYSRFMKLFQLMPHLSYYDEGIAFLHGGIPVDDLDIDKMGRSNRNAFTQILWNDPFDNVGYYPSYRGVGYIYGVDVTERFLEHNNLKGVVRGHEPVDGYRISQKGYTLTLFSRLGPPYWNHLAGVYHLNLKDFEKFRDEDVIVYRGET